jgi:hypothetical protein
VAGQQIGRAVVHDFINSLDEIPIGLTLPTIHFCLPGKRLVKILANFFAANKPQEQKLKEHGWYLLSVW